MPFLAIDQGSGWPLFFGVALGKGTLADNNPLPTQNRV